MEENFLKQTHAQRQEAAQTRREEKKRAEKERIMNEEDPERQRRLEVRCTKTVTTRLLKEQLSTLGSMCALVEMIHHNVITRQFLHLAIV